MRRPWRLFLILALSLLISSALTACAQESTTESASDQAQEQVKSKTEQAQESVDKVLNSAQDTVDKLVKVAGGLEARVDGLQIKSDLQQIQRKLNDAIDERGDKKTAAIEKLSDSFTDLIYRVETAAERAPSGGVVESELNDLAQKLRDVQKKLADVAASSEASSTSNP